MSRVFLETSALIDLLFKSEAERLRVQNAIPEGSTVISSQYVHYELCRGFLNYYRLLYNRGLQLRKWSELLEYVQNSRRATHRAGTMLEAFRLYLQNGRATGAFADMPEGMTEDEFDLVMLRAFLRRQIRRGWAKLKKTFPAQTTIDAIKCRQDIPAPYEDESGQFQHDLQTALCGKTAACGLKTYAAKYKADLLAVRDCLLQVKNPDGETTRRIRSLREICRNEKTDFSKQSCYGSSDALIVHEAPSDATIVSKNRQHIAPLCGYLKRRSQFF